MGTPTNRTPVRVARGSTTALNTGLSDIQEGEIVWDTTLNKLQVKEGSALEDHTVDTSTLAPIDNPTFTGVAGFSSDGVLINNDLKLHIDAANDLNYISNTGSGSDIHDLILSVKPARYIQLETDDGSGTKETLAKFQGDGAAELYHNGNKKIETTGIGVTVTGTVTATAGVLGVGDALLAGDQTWTGSQRGTIAGLTLSGTDLNMDMNGGNNWNYTLAGNYTLAQPTNKTAGQSGSIFLKQDGTGSRTLGYHGDWKWAGGTPPTLSTTADAVDRIDYIVDGDLNIHAVATLAVA